MKKGKSLFSYIFIHVILCLFYVYLLHITFLSVLYTSQNRYYDLNIDFESEQTYE